MYRRHLEKLARTRLDDVLLDEGLIERSDIEDAQAEQEMTGNQLSHVLFEREALDEWELAKIVSTHYSLPFVDVTKYSIPRPAAEALSNEFCARYSLLPIDVFGEAIAIAVCEMPAPELLKEIIERSKRTPFLYVAVRRAIHGALKDQAAAAAKAPKRTKAKKAKKKAAAAAKDSAAPAPAAEEPAAKNTPAEKPVAGEVAAETPAAQEPSGEPAMELIAPSPAEPEAPTGPPSAPLGELPPVTMKLGSSMHGPSAAAPVRQTSAAKAPVSKFGGAPKRGASKQGTQGGDGSWESIFDFGDDSVGK